GLFEALPCGEQHDRQVGVEPAQSPEQLDAFAAGGGLAREVHVLDDQVDVAARYACQCLVRRGRELHACAFQCQQDVERGANRIVVVDDQQRSTVHRPP